MESSVIRVDMDRISDWDSFHQVFKEELGFPDFYGRNMDAWIDCMSSLDYPEHGLSTVHVGKGEVLTMHLDHAKEFKERCPELFSSLTESAAFVNWRRTDKGRPAVLALSFRA